MSHERYIAFLSFISSNRNWVVAVDPELPAGYQRDGGEKSIPIIQVMGGHKGYLNKKGELLFSFEVKVPELIQIPPWNDGVMVAPPGEIIMELLTMLEALSFSGGEPQAKQLLAPDTCNLCNSLCYLTGDGEEYNCGSCQVSVSNDGWPSVGYCFQCENPHGMMRVGQSLTYACSSCSAKAYLVELIPHLQAFARQIHRRRAQHQHLPALSSGQETSEDSSSKDLVVLTDGEDDPVEVLARQAISGDLQVIACVSCNSGNLTHADGEANCGDCGARMTSQGELISPIKLNLSACQLCRDATTLRKVDGYTKSFCSNCERILDSSGYPIEHVCNLCQSGHLLRVQGEPVRYSCNGCDNLLNWSDLKAIMLNLLTTGQLKRLKLKE